MRVKEAKERWIAACEAEGKRPSSIRKYQEVGRDLAAKFGELGIRSITVDDVDALLSGWKHYAPSTKLKRFETVKAFFSFCVTRDWIGKNPAKAVKAPKVRHVPMLPFSDAEIEKLLWAIDTIREIHTQLPESTERKLRAMILLILHTGIRISDAVVMKPERIKHGKLLIYTQKTGTTVWCPVPQNVIDALKACDEGDPYYFWSGQGTTKTMITEWQERMKKACAIAGIQGGHFHRLRDTFSVRLLEKGVPLETVAVLLGNTVQVCQKHDAPWVKSRQTALEAAVKGTWA